MKWNIFEKYSQTTSNTLLSITNKKSLFKVLADKVLLFSASAHPITL